MCGVESIGIRVVHNSLLFRNEEGKHIVSPFEYVHHLQQKAALKPIFEGGLLTPYGRTPEDVAFAWTFTTQSVTNDLVRIREGLRGYGPLAHLSSSYPAEILSLEPMNSDTGVESYHLTPEKLVGAIRVLFDNLEKDKRFCEILSKKL